MRYSESIANSPPGSSHFVPRDLGRLSPTALRLALAPGPAAPPLADLAVALGDEPALLGRVAGRLDRARGERLVRLAGNTASPARRRQAGERLVKGLFWTLVYELAPERWTALAEAEPVHPGVLDLLGGDGCRVAEVAAGSGRLTVHLAARAARLVAVEPSAPLRRILARRLPPGVLVVGGLAEQLPLMDGWADLVVACASAGPDPPCGGEAVLAEFRRCLRPGGRLVLVNPEAPEWFEARGFRRTSFPAEEVEIRADPGLLDFFGPLCPLTEVLISP